MYAIRSYYADDAQLLGIADGEHVRLLNFRGWSVRTVQVTVDTCRGQLVAEGLFWETDECHVGINDLTSQKITDIGAGPTFHEIRVTLAAF